MLDVYKLLYLKTCFNVDNEDVEDI